MHRPCKIAKCATSWRRSSRPTRNLQAKMGDPAVLADQKEYNTPGQGIRRPGCAGARSRREYLQAYGRSRRGQGDARRPRHEGVRPGGDRRASRRKLPQLGRGHQVHAHPRPTRPTRRTSSWRSALAAGGDEAAIFAGDLYKMYERFASRPGMEDRDHGRVALPRPAVTRRSSSR